MSGARVGIIGARRVRQGLGPFVARHLGELGASVPCFLAAHPDAIPETERALSARGYTDLRRMLDAENLDALAILSPSESHERYLEAALSARLHALCEKPLLWGGGRLAERSRAVVERFAKARLLLVESCQWPYTLPAYRVLHPDTGPVERFAMRLSPASRGPRAMLGDSLSHPLSLLQALAPGATPRVERIQIEAAQGPALTIRFAYEAGSARVRCELRLVSQQQPPREAGYGVNGRWAERRIRPGDYTFHFADGAREVPVPDPLREQLRGFLAALEGTFPPPPGTAILERMAMLERILDALPIVEDP